MRVLENFFPNQIGVSFDGGIGAHLEWLFRKDRGMNAADNHRRAALLGFAHHAITRSAISGVNTDPHNVSRTYAFRIKSRDRLVNDDWIACKLGGGGARDNK